MRRVVFVILDGEFDLLCLAEQAVMLYQYFEFLVSSVLFAYEKGAPHRMFQGVRPASRSGGRWQRYEVMRSSPGCRPFGSSPGARPRGDVSRSRFRPFPETSQSMPDGRTAEQAVWQDFEPEGGYLRQEPEMIRPDESPHCCPRSKSRHFGCATVDSTVDRLREARRSSCFVERNSCRESHSSAGSVIKFSGHESTDCCAPPV